MNPNVPEALVPVLKPVFNLLPLNQAMGALVGGATRSAEAQAALVAAVETAIATPEMADYPAVACGLWLYIDELDRSHEVSQGIPTPTGSFWHAIMHRREGDFSNSHYWYRKVGKHPAYSKIVMAGGGAGAGTSVGKYDPHAFVDRVDHAAQGSDSGPDGEHPNLVSLQRHEWAALFEWCAEH